jgi:hypothetical protein
MDDALKAEILALAAKNKQRRDWAIAHSIANGSQVNPAKRRRDARRALCAVACDRKEPYSYSAARRVAHRINRKHTDATVMAYKCKLCGNWHVGNSIGERVND